MSKLKELGDGFISPDQFPVVGIGASAGGLEAVKLFLNAIPAKTGMAYVFVQHLSPTHKSSLPEILQKSANIPVHQITDNIHLEPDNLYILPSNKIVTATDGVLKLATLDDKHHSVKIIDLFFSSLAVVHQSYAVGIILSGLLDDGTLGLRAIKAYGGITFAQDKDSATYDDMPGNAISTGAVDFVLPPARIAEHLIAINHPFNHDNSKTDLLDRLPRQNEEIFKQLLAVLRARRGVDFTYYKTSTLKRRIVRRMALSTIEKPIDYLAYLKDNKPEQDALYNDMLISVTHFFRDQESFDLLCSTIFPALLKQKTENETLRIWIAGCATGEEAYSMAICLQELMGDKAAVMKIQVFASDISETAITKARSGTYRLNEMEGISPSRLQQFFTKQGGNYQVNKAIRDMCVFAHHNLLKDPPFSKMDLVSCRNVLIYLEPVLQKRALTTFNYSLNEGGFLMLGKSESIASQTELFTPFNNSEKIFKRKGTRGRFMHVTTQGGEQNFKDIDKIVQKKSTKQDIFKITDDLILSKYTPAGVLINEHFDIVQFRGSTEIWLSLSPGKASLNLLKMARNGLSFELRNLLHQVKRTNIPARKEGILFKLEGKQQYVDLEVALLTEAEDTYYIVLFKNALPPGGSLHVITDEQNQQASIDLRDLRIAQLEKELMQARADMRTVTEEQEAIYEELQSTNQELLSGSEELQTVNEELETSREELQSTNEEITIVNNELMDRNEQLNSARTYTEGIITTIGDPLIILDKDLKVKRATTGFYKKFKVNEKETEGRYLYDLGNKQWQIPALRDLLESILPDKMVVTNFEVEHVFPSIGRKIMCLTARKLEKVDGDEMILLSIEDITHKRQVEDGLAEVEKLFNESKERLKLAVDIAGLGTWDYNPLTGELILDSRCKELFNIEPANNIDYVQFIGMIHIDYREHVQNMLSLALAGKHYGEFETECRVIEVTHKRTKWIKFKGKGYFNNAGVAFRFVGTLLDITVQKLIDETTLELLKKKDEFISIASHELKTPITTLKSALQIIDRSIVTKEEMKPVYVFVQKALKQVNKLTELINDLLDVTKIQSGKLELAKTNFVINDLVTECVENMQPNYLQHKITIEGKADIMVYADRHRLEQVIINLISNAVKYSPKGKKVLINLFNELDSIKIAVTDFGIGIPDDKLPFIFDRFFRVEDTSINFAGLGLGLYISSEIIKRHHGSIGIDTKVDEGSTFWFTIPLLN